MNRRWILILSLFTASLILYSCKDDEGFHQVSTVERNIYLNINEYRSSEGLPTLVEQFLVFKEARTISDKMASGVYTTGDAKALHDVEAITANLGGTTSALISLTSNIENADSIVNHIIESPSLAEIIKDEFTQCGVGLSSGENQLRYIAIVLINIPN